MHKRDEISLLQNLSGQLLNFFSAITFHLELRICATFLRLLKFTCNMTVKCLPTYLSWKSTTNDKCFLTRDNLAVASPVISLWEKLTAEIWVMYVSQDRFYHTNVTNKTQNLRGLTQHTLLSYSCSSDVAGVTLQSSCPCLSVCPSRSTPLITACQVLGAKCYHVIQNSYKSP